MAGIAVANFSTSDDLTGQELPDVEALSALLAALPDLPDLNLEGFEDYSETDTNTEVEAEDEDEDAPRSWPEGYLNDAADEAVELPTTWDSMVAAANEDADLPPIPMGFAAKTQAGFEVAPMPEDKKSEDVPATGNDNDETEATQVLPRIRRFNFDDFARDVEDSYPDPVTGLAASPQQANRTNRPG